MENERDMVALQRVDSLAEQAYRALREQIVTGGLAAGERVTERGLGLRLGVSATPIREALRRLEQDRLVERVGPRQLRIATHSDESLRELLYTEAVVRAAAARFATAKITEETLDAMEALVAELEHEPENGEPEHQLSLARRFDELLLASADNAVLAGLIDTVSVFGWSLRIRAVQAMHNTPEVGLGQIQAHRRILTALRDRDADRVETLFREHLSTAINFILTHGH